MTRQQLVIGFAVILVVVIILYFLLKKKPKKPSTVTFSVSNPTDIWTDYANWMHTYITNYVKNPSDPLMNNYNAMKNELTTYYLNKYNKQKVMYFMAMFDRFVKINIENVQAATGAPVSFPDNGHEFSDPFAAMLGITDNKKINSIAALWVNHANNVEQATMALKSDNSTSAQTIFVKDLGLVTQLANF